MSSMARLRIGRCRVRKSLVGGLLILLLVDVLWVGSAGLTRYIFKQESYDKPLFTTYFKTALFSLYLLAFVFWRPWQRRCVCRWQWRRRRLTAGTPEESSESTPLLSDHTPSQSLQQGESGECAGEGGEGSDGGDPGEGGEGGDCDVNKHTGQCEYRSVDGAEDSSMEPVPLTAWPHPPAAEEEGEREVEEEGEKLLLEPGCPAFAPCSAAECMEYVAQAPSPPEQRRLFRVPSKSTSINNAVCPVFDPSMPVCLLGPPVTEPLHCYESEDSDGEFLTNKPLPSCQKRCCKVMFKPTVEVRETIGEDHCVMPRRCPLRKEGQRSSPRPPSQPLPVLKVALLALVFGLLWFFANYLYALALVHSSVAAVNTLSATSGVFVMLLAALPVLHTTDTDRLTLSRLLVTLVSVCGVVMVGLSPSSSDSTSSGSGDHISFSPGATLAVGGAVLYAVYLVLLRKVAGDHDALEIPMFFGFVGLFCGVLLLPLVAIWNASGIEPFSLPSNSVWTLLLVNGFVGTVLSELLWLWAVFLTSPLLGTLALSLVTPFSIGYTIAFGEAGFSWLFVVGAVMIVVGFVGVAFMEHFGAWDPLWAGLKLFFVKAKDISVHRGYHSLSTESKRLVVSRPPVTCPNEYIIV